MTVAERKRVRLPGGATVDAHPEPDVDLAADDVRDSHGNRVDDAYANRVVDRVHRQLGRPSLGASGQSPRVSFRVPDELLAKARRRADADGTTVSKLARKAFEEFLEAS